MYLQLAKRFLIETDKRSLWKLAWNMGSNGKAIFRMLVEDYQVPLRRNALPNASPGLAERPPELFTTPITEKRR